LPPSVQLTLDGREVPVPSADQPRATAPLTASQREILLWIRDHGQIRSVEAGAIVHAHRTLPCCSRYGRSRPDGIGCCKWAASDGGDALKRLMGRGLVRRGDTPGVWEAAS